MKFRNLLRDEYAIMVGLPLRILIGSIILTCFIGIPKILSAFGFHHPYIDIMIMPVIAFFVFVIVFCIWGATWILSPSRFIIFMPIILVLSLALVYALYIATY